MRRTRKNDICHQRYPLYTMPTPLCLSICLSVSDRLFIFVCQSLGVSISLLRLNICLSIYSCLLSLSVCLDLCNLSICGSMSIYSPYLCCWSLTSILLSVFFFLRGLFLCSLFVLCLFPCLLFRALRNHFK